MLSIQQALPTLILFTFTSCHEPAKTNFKEAPGDSFYLGADLSYVNEMEECGAVYKNLEGEENDVFTIFEHAGANLVRVRLWHTPTWSSYSHLDDVKKTIRRIKNHKMNVLLDVHYSDDWADPSTQEIPAAWLSELDNTDALSQLLYDYTYDVLNELNNEGLLPNVVQIGNEINGNILTQGDPFPIDWARNSTLLNTGIQAVRDLSSSLDSDIEVLLHIAQPENGLWWFEEATQNGVTDFDWIGLSYYSAWSQYDLSNLEPVLTDLRTTYDKKLMIVETAYPFTLEDADSANNILGSQAIVPDHPPTQQGQLDYLIRLKNVVSASGGSGLVYWEPAWVSTDCNTQWGTGSHWDNATLFDHQHQATRGFEFYKNND
jgi:arabinogalactan endo-1,4-beta-galactosidase